jgi:hypothetical protein
MATDYGPFASGSGADFGEADWSSLLGAAVPDGVIVHANSLIGLNQLAVSADGSILGVYVATGYAAIRGHWFKNDATASVVLDAADALGDRLDLIVLELDRSAKTVVLNKVTGIPSVLPAMPALTRTSQTWQIPLAQVRVDAATSLVLADDVTDMRLFAQSVSKSVVSASGLISTTSTSTIDMSAMAISKYTDGGHVDVQFNAIVYQSTADQNVEVYVQIDGGTSVLMSSFVSSDINETGQAAWTYPIVGLAAGYHTFKVRWQVSGGTGNAQSRHMTVTEYR